MRDLKERGRRRKKRKGIMGRLRGKKGGGRRRRERWSDWEGRERLRRKGKEKEVVCLEGEVDVKGCLCWEEENCSWTGEESGGGGGEEKKWRKVKEMGK